MRFKPSKPGRIVVSLFCGGRGGSSLIREFIRHPNIELNVLINAYDDGLSTGVLRDFIPGMLGPSDFRKNLAALLDLHSSHQYAISRLLEFRIPDTYTEDAIQRLRLWASGSAADYQLPDEFDAIVRELDSELRSKIRRYLSIFFEYQATQERKFSFHDCSVGNLVFAGAYLKNDRNFNAATAELAGEFQSRARLINVTQGENRVLVALKETGEVLEEEARVVNAQTPDRIAGIFLLERALSPVALSSLQQLPDVAARHSALQALDRPVALSAEARDAILNCDILIFGPGTQYSSLMPSYKTTGIADTIASSRASLRVFVVNIHQDHDIQSLSGQQLVACALELLGDPQNLCGHITHVLYTCRSAKPELLVARGDAVMEAMPANIE